MVWRAYGIAVGWGAEASRVRAAGEDEEVVRAVCVFLIRHRRRVSVMGRGADLVSRRRESSVCNGWGV